MAERGGLVMLRKISSRPAYGYPFRYATQTLCSVFASPLADLIQLRRMAERGIGEAQPRRYAIIRWMPHLRCARRTFLIPNPLSEWIVCFANGERGIRTLRFFRLNSFQDYRIRPLCHLSKPAPALKFF